MFIMAILSKESETAKLAEVHTKVNENEANSSDEEIMDEEGGDEKRKAKEKADSDHEFLQAAMEVEYLQIREV